MPGRTRGRIDPGDWARLTTAEQDLLLAQAVQSVSALFDDDKSRETIEQAGLEVLRQLLDRLEREND